MTLASWWWTCVANLQATTYFYTFYASLDNDRTQPAAGYSK